MNTIKELLNVISLEQHVIVGLMTVIVTLIGMITLLVITFTVYLLMTRRLINKNIEIISTYNLLLNRIVGK